MVVFTPPKTSSILSSDKNCSALGTEHSKQGKYAKDKMCWSIMGPKPYLNIVNHLGFYK